MLRFSCTRKYNELTVVYSSVCMFCIKSCMSCTYTCLRRKREITYLSVVLPGLKSIHFFFSFFKPESRNKRKDRDCPCEIQAWLKYHRVVECSTVIGQIDLSLGETTVIRLGELHLDKTNHLACEQALQGALAAGQEMERAPRNACPHAKNNCPS